VLMSNAPLPTPHVEKHRNEVVDEEATPVSGVRKMLDAFEERDLSRIRWSSVLAGLFLALGALSLLGLFGLAVGVSVLDMRGQDPMGRLSMGMGIWMGFASLVALFVGSFAAAKLGGSIRRGDGALAGALTWATSLALLLVVAGMGSQRLVVDVPADAPTSLLIADEQMVEADPHTSKMQLVSGAWGAFAGASISLVAAVVGGALGAVGKRQGERMRAPRPRADEHIPLY